MAKSKYQLKAKVNVKNKVSANKKKRPQYYDENLPTKKKSSSYAVFIIFIFIIAGGIIGVGSILDKMDECIPQEYVPYPDYFDDWIEKIKEESNDLQN